MKIKASHWKKYVLIILLNLIALNVILLLQACDEESRELLDKLITEERVRFNFVEIAPSMTATQVRHKAENPDQAFLASSVVFTASIDQSDPRTVYNEFRIVGDPALSQSTLIIKMVGKPETYQPAQSLDNHLEQINMNMIGPLVAGRVIDTNQVDVRVFFKEGENRVEYVTDIGSEGYFYFKIASINTTTRVVAVDFHFVIQEKGNPTGKRYAVFNGLGKGAY